MLVCRMLWWLACTSPVQPDDPEAVRYEGFAQVVPSVGLPPEVVPQAANNNLDIEMYDGRLFLAFRSAPTHFASVETVMWVVSTEDEETWRYEGSFARGTDLREPQLVVIGEELWLYFAVLGESPLDFEPEGMRASRRLGVGAWTESEPSYLDTFIPWRIKEVDGEIQMIGYVGGENVYDADGEPIRIHWVTTTDGMEWTPVVGDDPVLMSGGGSEADYAFLDDGTLIAVVRNEAGDETGFGSKICRAEAGSLGDWDCISDPRKYDSPLVFVENNEVWLVGRRNVTDTGHYDLGYDELEPVDQYFAYQLDYWGNPKRCSVWRVDAVTLEVSFAYDLPSGGDTCFPEQVDLEGGRRLLYNYSSPVDGLDLSWLEGQTGETGVYRMELVFD